MTTEATRAQFEAWASDNGKWPQAVKRNGRGEYVLMTTHISWKTWQAAMRSPSVTGLVEAAKALADDQVHADLDEPDYETETSAAAVARNKGQRAYWNLRAVLATFTGDKS